MPLPLDLASVAWLAVFRRDIDRERKDEAWRWLDNWHFAAARKSLGIHGSRVLDDLRAVVRTQANYIESLETQLLPHLVAPKAEQEALL